jgi:signal transduction histidine kinase
VLVTVILAILVQALCVYYTVNRRTILGSFVIGLDEDLNVDEVDKAAQAAGFRLGDRIVRLGDQPVSRIFHYRQAIDRFAAGSSVQIQVQRNGQLVTLEPISVQTVSPESIFFVYNLAGLVMLAIATWVVIARPQTKSARLFFLTSLALGLYLSTINAKTEFFVYLHNASLTLAPALAIHFFLTFPRERGLARSRWWILLYLPSLVLMAFTFAAFYDAVQDGYGLYHAPIYRFWNGWVDSSYLGLSAVFGLVVMGHTYASTPKSIEKRQIQWIMLGLAAAALVVAVDVLLTRFEAHTAWSPYISILVFFLLPISFALGILRYRLWDLDVVLSRSAVYGLLTACLAAIYLLLVSVVSVSLGIAIGGSDYAFILFVSALVVGVLFNPGRAWLQALIDRTFFRRQVDYQRALARWSERLSTSLRFADLADLMLDEVPAHIQVSRAWLLVLDEEETFFEALLRQAETGEAALDFGALTPLPDRVPTGDHQQLSIPVHGRVITRLSQPGKLLLLYDDGHDDPALARWRQAGVRLVLPLLMPGPSGASGKLVGVYLLGDKLSGDVYQRQELELLRTLTNQAAVAITNARLYEQVHAFSQELEVKVEERTKELRDFVSAVYHELSTPITSVRGYTDLLLDGNAGPLTPRQTRYLNTTHRSIGRLLRLVGDLADISRIEDGRLTIRPEPLDLDQAVAETVSGLADVIEEKGLQVAVSMPAGDCMVQGDSQRVVQILTNLVSNACRYTPAGGQIQIVAQATDGAVEIQVSDTGIGIQPDELDQIFERFYRSQDPLVQAQSGTGLGLAITKSLVELHGSRLWVDSVVGQGSTFGFALPLAGTPEGGAP